MDMCLMGVCEGEYNRSQKEDEGIFPGAAVTSDCELLGWEAELRSCIRTTRAPNSWAANWIGIKQCIS